MITIYHWLSPVVEPLPERESHVKEECPSDEAEMASSKGNPQAQHDGLEHSLTVATPDGTCPRHAAVLS
jgi:hypothetical protein